MVQDNKSLGYVLLVPAKSSSYLYLEQPIGISFSGQIVMGICYGFQSCIMMVKVYSCCWMYYASQGMYVCSLTMIGWDMVLAVGKETHMS